MRQWTVRDVRDHCAHVIAWDEYNRLNHIQQKAHQGYQSFVRYDCNRQMRRVA